MTNILVPVLDGAFCAWGPDLKEKNIEYIRGIDPSYFQYVCKKLTNDLKGEDKQHAALMLRANYSLCLETLFGLVGALLQSPHCVPGWIMHAKTEDIRKAVEAIQEGAFQYPVRFSPRPANIDWTLISNILLSCIDVPDNGFNIEECLSKLWTRLSSDFLNDLSTHEYNGIKHGLRVRPGGFSLKIGKEPDGPGSAPEQFIDLGGNLFGSSYFKSEPLRGVQTRRDPNFVMRRHSINWSPDSLIERTKCAAQLIDNIKFFLLIFVCNVKYDGLFYTPDAVDEYEKPWTDYQIAVMSMTIDYNVRVPKEGLPTRANLKAAIENQWS